MSGENEPNESNKSTEPENNTQEEEKKEDPPAEAGTYENRVADGLTALGSDDEE